MTASPSPRRCEKPGAYLLTAQMADGNLSRIIVWVSDTVIVKKQLDGKVLLLRGRRRHRPAGGQGRRRVLRLEAGAGQAEHQRIPGRHRPPSATTTDADGQVILRPGQAAAGLSSGWSPPARRRTARAAATASPTWASPASGTASIYDPEYNQTKVFTITDRPVYRPEQTVQFKFWVAPRQVRPGRTPRLRRQVVHRADPQSHRAKRSSRRRSPPTPTAASTGEFPLPKGAMLGVYGLQVVNHGGGSFRVEEYKKPEFEVKVEAPKEPVQPGREDRRPPSRPSTTSAPR